MKLSSLKAPLATLALAIGGAGTASAAPAVVDYEAAAGTLTFLAAGDSYVENGVTTRQNSEFGFIDRSFCDPVASFCITNNATSYLNVFGGGTVSIHLNGLDFSLASFDASFLPDPTFGGLFSGLEFGLLIEAIGGDGTPLATSQLVPLQEDPQSLGSFLFNTYAGDPAFTGVQSLTFSACMFVGLDCTRDAAVLGRLGVLTTDLQFALDNLAINVPEPASAWLLALGIAALGSRRRRQA